MSQAAFFNDDAQQRAAKTVEQIETKTAAEVVIVLRSCSGHYRHTDYLFGFVCAMGALCALLFLPEPFLIDTWPLELTVVFALGALLSANFGALRKLLTSRRLMEDSVRQAARAHFVSAGIGATREHTGVLVYVSMFERHVEIVTDVGVAAVRKKAAFDKALTELSAAVHEARFDHFLDALLHLTIPLSKVAPRRADDTNELPDKMELA